MSSKRMASTRATSSGTTVDNAHLMDIHHEEHHQENIIQTDIPTKIERQANRPPIKPARESKRQQQWSFNRQVSLETGFSAMNRESNAKEDRKKALSRSGNSFGGFGSANGVDGVRKPAADFSIFRTKSTLGKQNSLLPSWKANEGDGTGCPAAAPSDNNNNSTVPAGRYFAALRGPELDQVKDFEDILLPKDETWPFLLRFPIGCFGICLGLSSQAILWQAMATSPSTAFLHVTPFINLALWLLSLLALVSVSITYVLKCVYYFEAVRREYFHPVRVNFFFAPWIVCMFLVIGAPKMLFPGPPHPAVWCVFMGPVFCLELKIYGQWLSGGKRRLSKVANPSSHLSVVGNFVGAILAAKVGWEEPAKFLWAVGFAHYLVVFVTLYQRLPTSEALPKELHPVYCMFIAAPSAASIAWETIYGEFDGLSRTCYFIALFLYVSLVVRINFFWGFRFSVAWWSYTFPMTTASLATIKYAEQVDSLISKGLAVTLSFMSSTMVSSLLVSTLLHAFFWRTLFPNDLAIAITKRRVVVGKEGKDKEKEKKPATKKTYDIRRWAKQSPLNFVSSITKHNQGNNNDSHGEKQTDDDGIKSI